MVNVWHLYWPDKICVHRDVAIYSSIQTQTYLSFSFGAVLILNYSLSLTCSWTNQVAWKTDCIIYRFGYAWPCRPYVKEMTQICLYFEQAISNYLYTPMMASNKCRPYTRTHTMVHRQNWQALWHDDGFICSAKHTIQSIIISFVSLNTNRK